MSCDTRSLDVCSCRAGRITCPPCSRHRRHAEENGTVSEKNKTTNALQVPNLLPYNSCKVVLFCISYPPETPKSLYYSTTICHTVCHTICHTVCHTICPTLCHIIYVYSMSYNMSYSMSYDMSYNMSRQGTLSTRPLSLFPS